MIGIDTNVLVRYLTQDDPEQSDLANALIKRIIEQKKIVWLCQMTLCETIWVLSKCYKLSRNELVAVVYELLLTPQLKLEEEETIWLAVKDFEINKDVGFVDCLIGRQNFQKGCEMTYSFDKGAYTKLPSLYTQLTSTLYIF